MGREELTAEALTQLIAGSDTTSNSSCAITYYLASSPSAQAKLHEELSSALGPLSGHIDSDLPTYDQVKSLPYLNACINESLRLHSTSSMGLARIVPAGGMEVAGRRFEEGCILSVPSYTIHRDASVWGQDVDAFRPERWLEGTEAEKERMNVAFNPFSFGPRYASVSLLILQRKFSLLCGI